MFSTQDMNQQATILTRIAHLIENGHIHSIVSKNLEPICAKNLAAAHDLLATQRTLGKLVLHGF